MNVCINASSKRKFLKEYTAVENLSRAFLLVVK